MDWSSRGSNRDLWVRSQVGLEMEKLKKNFEFFEFFLY